MALDFFKAAVGAGKQWSDALQLVRNSLPGHNLEHFQTCRIALFFFFCGPFLRSQEVTRACVPSK